MIKKRPRRSYTSSAEASHPCTVPAPAWLLIDADWVHTRQSIPYLPRLKTIISVGRVRWIRGSPYEGKDNCAWHLFDRPQPNGQAAIRFIGRTDFAGANFTRRAA